MGKYSPMKAIVCPRCGSPDLLGLVRESQYDLVLVDWLCESCGHSWTSADYAKDVYATLEQGSARLDVLR